MYQHGLVNYVLFERWNVYQDDHVEILKPVKHQIPSLCLGNVFCHPVKKWTTVRLKYLMEIGLFPLNRECLNEYLVTLGQMKK